MSNPPDGSPSSPTPQQVMARFGRVQRLFWLIISSAFCAMSLMKLVALMRSPVLPDEGAGQAVLFVPGIECVWYALGIWLSLSPEKRQVFVLHVVLSVIWILFLSQRL